MRKILVSVLMMACMAAAAQTGNELEFQKWALTPPMGWNSWDCFGPTVVESEVKANADYMAEKLLPYGWEYVVVDIRWFVENDKAGGYNQTNPIYVIDQWGRYTPALNRFPSAADGVGFKALADYCHSKGLKFGIHLMRGLPKLAAQKKLPVKGADGITCDMICNNDSACTWLRDNYKVDCTKAGAQEYYNSCFDMYAEWGVDFVKIDDLSRPYHTGEIEMIRHAIDQCGRPIVLSMSPGETPLDRIGHVAAHANMWRTVDDFWDNWSQLNYQFGICAKWAPYIAPGTWPDADMLPLGRISIRGERGAERWCSFSDDEQLTMMNLWTIFKSPLMFGGNLPDNDREDNPSATNALLTNKDVLYMHSYSVENRELSNYEGRIVWAATDPASGDKFAAVINAGSDNYVNAQDALWRSGTISYLTTGYSVDASVNLPEGCTTLALIVTDGGDGFDCDHADWINPVVTLADGTEILLSDSRILRSQVGWGTLGINKNLEGGQLSVDGTKYDKGIAVHANSIVLFEIPDNAVKFTAIAGIDNTGTDQGSKSSVEFMVFSYDPTMRNEWTDQWTAGNVQLKVDPAKQIACSGYVGREAGIQQREIEADITGTEILYLVVTNGGDGFAYDHADWANPVLLDENGNETSLTSIKWEPNPVNGWYQPKLNRNNDGNVMSIAGVTYDKGFGCNSPAKLMFRLPEGHKYVKFKSIVGYDDDAANAPEGVSMEFRVFTEDPSPIEEQNVAVDLRALGYDTDQECTITNMWASKEEGTYKNTDFSVLLQNHASALYRISPQGRTQNASVQIKTQSNEADASKPFCLEIAVTGADEGWVQLVCDGKVIGTLPLDGNSSVKYVCTGLSNGEHTFKAAYSGTSRIANAVSEEVKVTFTDAVEGVVSATLQACAVRAADGGIEIVATESDCIDVYRIDGAKAVSAKVAPGVNRVSLPVGVYIVMGEKILVI